MTSRKIVLAALLVVGLTHAAEAATIASSPTGKRVMHPAFKDAGRQPGIQIWRVENFEPVPVKSTDYGKFHEGDSYIVLSTKEQKGVFSWDVHFWLGEKTSQDESGAAAILTVELDDQLGGGPVQHREVQEHESQLFLSYFKSGIRYLPGGVASGFSHVDINAAGEKKLYQVKGKRNIRVRQVKLDIKSMNKGDCFILDSGREIFVYCGSKAKRQEKLKAISAANNIRDQDHNGRAKVNIIEEASPVADVESFFKEFGPNVSAAQIADEPAGGDDQEFEKNQEATVSLYKVSDAGGKLVSEKLNQKPLRQEMLKTDDCFILDTITSGIYVWVGKKSTTAEKVEALKKGQSFLSSNNYPAWTRIQRVIEGGEPTAFKEYFAEWRDMGFMGGLGRGSPTPSRKTREIGDSRKCGLAQGFMPDQGNGEVEVFRVEDEGLLAPVDPGHYGMFFGGDAYIVKYKYNHKGMDKYIIYKWQGKDCSPEEKAALAVQGLKMDNDLNGRALQVRVMQGEEPAHFLKLFQGKIVIFSGGKGKGFKHMRDYDTYNADGNRMFQIIGTCSDNIRAIQVAEQESSLNPDDAFLVETPTKSYLWVGSGCTKEEQQMGSYVRSRLCPDREFVVVTEGNESDEFWQALGGRREVKRGIIEVHESFRPPARLLHCYINRYNKFLVEEITDFRQKEFFPDDIMIVDAGDTIYLWIGNDATPDEKRQALKLAESYLASRGKFARNVVVTIRQGYEPEPFIGLFPEWDDGYWSTIPSYEDLVNNIDDLDNIIDVDDYKK